MTEPLIRAARRFLLEAITALTLAGALIVVLAVVEILQGN